jgi:Cys-rich protein (TIGR01571 family)
MSDWQSPIFGCFSDPKLCVFVFCCPIYAYGKSAEAVGEDCLLHAILVSVGYAPITRWRIRKARNIEGSMLSDVLCHCLLPCCALIQEAKETGWNVPEGLNVIATKNDKMARA